MAPFYTLFMLSCFPARETFPLELAEVVCARAYECSNQVATADTDSDEYIVCVEEVERMSWAQMCGFSGWQASRCLADARSESCAERDERVDAGDYSPYACMSLFVCD